MMPPACAPRAAAELEAFNPPERAIVLSVGPTRAGRPWPRSLFVGTSEGWEKPGIAVDGRAGSSVRIGSSVSPACGAVACGLPFPLPFFLLFC
jgi:hypothetical protein